MKRFSEEQLRVLEKSDVDCKDVENLFCDYVERDLPGTLRARLDAHIRCCTCCQSFQDEYLLVIDMARSLGARGLDLAEERPVDTGVHDRLRSALKERLGISIPSVE